MMTTETRPAFEVRGSDGRTWKVYEDGRTEGFPPDVIIFNRIPGLIRSAVNNQPVKAD